MTSTAWLDREDEDQITDRAVADALVAYEAAKQARLPLSVCFRMGVAAWCRVHPDQSLDYAAQQAVTVILDAKASLKSSSG
jgi:hypothetical protein